MDRRGGAVKSALNRRTCLRKFVHTAVIDMRTPSTIAAERPPRPSHWLQVLGGLRLATIDGATVELPTRKSALLLAYLAVPAGAAHARDKLADLLWSTSGQEQARGSLRHALAALRKVLGPDAIVAPRDAVRLRPGVLAVDLDAIAAIADGRVAPEIGGAGSPAATLWHGGFLDGVSADGEALGDWLVFERTRSRGLRQAALERAVAALGAASRHREAIDVATYLVALDPLREHSHRTLMQVYAACGERSKALEQFRQLTRLLLAELGVAPSAQSAALAREIEGTDVNATTLFVASAAPARVTVIAPELTAAMSQRRIAVAVLPFQSLGEMDDLTFFADGFSSDLVAGLSRISELSVIAWQSSAQVSGRSSEAAASAAELGAAYALTGNVRRVEDQFRISTQLVAAAARTWIWAERYDLTATGILAAQDRIVAGIIGAVDAGVRRAERETARATPIPDLDAWSLNHRGLWHAYRFTREDVVMAEQFFAAAIAKAPIASGPHAGLAYTALIRTQWHYAGDPRASIARGLEHARRAIALDEYDAYAHTVLGRLLLIAGDPMRAIEHLHRALDLNPSHAHAYYGLGHAYYVTGDFDAALDHVDTALRLSPKDPLASMFLTMGSFCYFMRGDLDAAEAAARRARNLLSRETWSRLALATVLQKKGDAAGAREAVAEACTIEPELSMAAFATLVQHIPVARRDPILVALAAAGLR